MSTSVYQVLAEHQVTDDWNHRDLLCELHRWAKILDFEFNLKIPTIVLCVDRLRRATLGHFRPGHNGFGLRHEIAINHTHPVHREPWEVLGTLLHELLHAWQEAHGRPGKGNYHNREFHDKALACGLIVDEWGHTQYAPQSPFFDLLRKHGVFVPEIPVPVHKPKGCSKLKKWSCGCTNVRVAIGDFEALCLRCGNKFLRAD